MSDTRKTLNILLIADEIDFLKATSKALRRIGFSVKKALIGNETRFLEEKPDLLVLSIGKPGTESDQTLYQIRYRWSNTPFILLSPYEKPPRSYQASNPAAYLKQPCKICLLAEKIYSVLSSSPGGASESIIEVLLVDDEEELLESLSRVLGRRGMNVISARNAEEALRLLQSVSVDVAVVDIKMPGMDGIQLLEKLKRLYPRLEIIILTGHPSIDTLLLSTLIGAYEYTRKPPDIVELSTLIRRAFEKRERRREAERQALIRNSRNYSAFL